MSTVTADIARFVDCRVKCEQPAQISQSLAALLTEAERRRARAAKRASAAKDLLRWGRRYLAELKGIINNWREKVNSLNQCLSIT